MKRKTKTKCKHTNCDYVNPIGASVRTMTNNLADPEWCQAVSARCANCYTTLSLGPSNDDPEAVQVEMSEAEHLADIAVACDGDDICDVWGDDETTTYASGNLCAFNATLWPWDPTRPIAGQYEEWFRTCAVAKQHAHDEALRIEAYELNAPVREAGSALSEHLTRAAIAGATAARHAERDAGQLWTVRSALVRLLWRSVNDDSTCTCDHKDQCPECQAMSALGLGDWQNADHARDVLLGDDWSRVEEGSTMVKSASWTGASTEPVPPEVYAAAVTITCPGCGATGLETDADGLPLSHDMPDGNGVAHCFYASVESRRRVDEAARAADPDPRDEPIEDEPDHTEGGAP